MHKLRLMACAALFHGTDLLMMKRSPLRTLSPGKWAAVGGHLEPEEIGDPRRACLREIEEETGLVETDLKDLKLQYILLRLNGNELRQQFVYVGESLRRDVGTTDEGELHWIPSADILERDIPFIYREVLRHYLTYGPADHVWIATAGLFQEEARNESEAEAESAREKRTPGLLFTPLTDPKVV